MAKKLLMGNEAFAHAALEAGVRVVAGYPGTPSSELIETIAKLRAQGVAHGVHVEWSTNEKAALELCAGASYCGARTLFACKQVGLNVASDALMSLNYVGVKGGMVLFVADDPGPISSQTEQDTRRFAQFAKVPVLDPATPEQGFAMMKAAFELSERYGTPVIVRPTTRICHASTFFDVAEETHALPVPEEGFVKDPKWVIFPKRSYEAHGEINERLRAMAADFGSDPLFAQFNPVEEHDSTSLSPKVAIVAGGVSAAYVREALDIIEREALAAGAFVPPYTFVQVGTPYPFPKASMCEALFGFEHILVLEELDSVLEDALNQHAQDIAGVDTPVSIYGKFLDGDLKGKRVEFSTLERGENSVEDAARQIARLFDRYTGEQGVLLREGARAELLALVDGLFGSTAVAAYSDPLPVRPPVLCAGCPHRGSFYAVKRALGKRDAVLCGDIGCYTLGNAKPLDAVDTCLCMGAGITMAQGFAVAEPHKKHVSFVGDSTFFASALTGIVNAVYNGHDITVCVLDNATTAMTGSQPHPGTGVTLMGERRKPIDIEGMLRAMGVECIVAADPFDLAESIDAAREAIDFEGPSAIIFRAPCIQLKKPAPAASVDAETCTGCKKCITEIGCPGIGFNIDAVGGSGKKRGQAFVDASLCNGCGLCAQVCPFSCIQLAKEEGAR